MIYITSINDKNKMSSTYIRMECNNDIINDVHWVIKCDVYQQKINLHSNKIRDISFFSSKHVCGI